MEHWRILVNPRFIAALIAYVQVPPSQWADAIALETVVRDLAANIVTSLRNAAVNLCSERPVLLAISMAAPTILSIAPPSQQTQLPPSPAPQGARRPVSYTHLTLPTILLV